jgi:hypothetical protein
MAKVLGEGDLSGLMKATLFDTAFERCRANPLAI